MYGIFPYIYHTNQPNVGKYTSPMDPIWVQVSKPFPIPMVFIGHIFTRSFTTFPVSESLSQVNFNDLPSVGKGWGSDERVARDDVPSLKLT